MVCTCKNKKHKCTFTGCNNHVIKAKHINRYLGVCEQHYGRLFFDCMIELIIDNVAKEYGIPKETLLEPVPEDYIKHKKHPNGDTCIHLIDPRKEGPK